MSLLRRLADILELLLVAFIAYWVMVLLTRGPEVATQVAKAVQEFVEGVTRRVEEFTKHVTSRGLRETVREKETGGKERVYRDCVSYMREAYGYHNGLITGFCKFVADVVWHTAGLVDPSDIYETLYYHYAYYYREVGYDRRTALAKAIEKTREKYKEYLEGEVELV